MLQYIGKESHHTKVFNGNLAFRTFHSPFVAELAGYKEYETKSKMEAVLLE